LPRLDLDLCQRGLCDSRSLAARMIREGYVSVNGTVCTKPSRAVAPDDVLAICENPLTRYVSRGGLKLEAALREFQVNPAGWICADLGASTGGFTHCLLQHGAKRVYAVENGTAQLHPSLLTEERVISMEQTDGRTVVLPEPMDLVVMDVSFISQSLFYPAVSRLLSPKGRLISLIKPQFEVGRGLVGSSGVVKNEKLRLECIRRLEPESLRNGLKMIQTIRSPIEGGDGNMEYLALFAPTEGDGKER